MIRKRTDESEYAEKVWIHNIMKLKVNGFTFVLAFCLLIIFCVHVWKSRHFIPETRTEKLKLRRHNLQ